MKKLFVIFIIVAFGFSAISCDKTCKCTGTKTETIEGVTEEPKTTPVDMVVGEMKAADCEVYRYAPDTGESTTVVTHDVVCRPE